MKLLLLAPLLLLSSTLFAAAPSGTPAPVRPKILGLSHAAFYVADLANARPYYEEFLGYTSVTPAAARGMLRFKINDVQAVEIHESPGMANDADRAHHFAY